MAQSRNTKYLTIDRSITFNVHRVILPQSPGEADGVCAVGGCVVDGALHDAKGSLHKNKESSVLIQSSQNITICSDNIDPRRSGASVSTPASDITIYYYQSNIDADRGRGVPVVLNLSKSNQFLKCTFKQNKAVLSLEFFEKEKLDLIYKSDPLTWPFVFYLSCTKDGWRHFESAECSGWFVRTKSLYGLVCMDEHRDKYPEEKSYFLILSRSVDVRND